MREDAGPQGRRLNKEPAAEQAEDKGERDLVDVQVDKGEEDRRGDDRLLRAVLSKEAAQKHPPAEQLLHRGGDQHQ